jgi:hypothetical protein
VNYRIVLVAMGIALLGDCRSAPVYNVNEAPVVVTPGKNYNGWIENLDREIRNELLHV